MKTYTTKAGDMFDAIAWRELGSCKHTDKLIDANRHLVATFIFDAGIELIIPDISDKSPTPLPPWKRS